MVWVMRRRCRGSEKYVEKDNGIEQEKDNERRLERDNERRLERHNERPI